MTKKPKVLLPKVKAGVDEKEEYINIPVVTSAYENVSLVSEAQGFGKRGRGAFIDTLVKRELPECVHDKAPVSIEYFGIDFLPGHKILRYGFYCETCKRVYAKISETELMLEDGAKLLKAVRG